MYNYKTTVSEGENENSFNNNLIELMEFIVSTHHSFVRNALQKILNYSNQVELNNLIDKPNELNGLIEHLFQDMHNHMEKEERILFPLIKYLVETEKFGERPKTRNYGTVRNPIRQMLSEHETALEIIKKIRNVLTKARNDKINNDPLALLFPLISEFETDLQKHIHLENDILFPRIIELENKLLHT